VCKLSVVKDKGVRREGGVRTTGRGFLPVVGLSLFLLFGCRFAEPSAPRPSPGGPLPADAAAAGGAETVEGDAAAIARLANTPDGVLLAEVRRRESVAGALDALFAISPLAPEPILRAGAAEASALADAMTLAVLREWIAEAPRHPQFLPIFLGELADRRYLVGDLMEARSLAQTSLDLSSTGPASERARSILDGRADSDLRVAASIAVILSPTGSPAFRQISEEMLEGIEVALTLEERVSGVPIRLLTYDDGGTSAGVTQVMAALRDQGVAGIVGPIYDPVVASAAALRTSSLPLISPSARFLPEGVPGVFSLSGSDPSAGRALAELVLNRGVRDVVLLHSASPEMQEEARWFREAYLARGGAIRRILTYPPATTAFSSILEEIAGLAPRGLVILLPAGGSDIQQLASQVTFYGVDQIPNLVRFGNEIWASPAALQGVDPRHTNGVLAVSRTQGVGGLGPGWEEFQREYEQHFHRTLRSSAPAFGFDAARLLLQAARRGGGVPARTLETLNEVRDYPGATGTLSIVEGRIERRYYPVRIENRLLVPLAP